MSLEQQQELESQYVMHTFARKPVELVSGKGMEVEDAEGNTYLDFIAGIGVCSLGHCHPVITKALQDQSQRLIHVSNYYYIEGRGELSRKISGLLNGGDPASPEPWQTFYANSGAEANECAIKLARLYARKNAEEAARAAADDENVGLVRGDDVLFGDFGLLAEPVAVVFVGLLVGDDFNGNFALGLRNALGGGLGDGLRRDRGAGDAVDFGGLSGHQVLLERVGGGLTDPRGFVGDVEHDVDDAVGVKGHRDRDFADAGGLGGIRAWPVDAGGSRTSGRSGERGAARNARAEECTTGERLVHDEFRIEWDPQGEAAGLP